MNDDSRPVCQIIKNSREIYQLRLGEFKGHHFADMRIYSLSENGDTVPTKRGLAISPALWGEFRKGLAQLEEAMVQKGWLDKEDLEE